MRDSALLKDILRLIADYWFRPFSQTPFAPAMHLSLAAPARLLHLHPSCSRTSQSQTGLQARPWDPACPASRQDSLSASSRQYLLSLASAACLFLAPAAAAADDTTLSFNKNCIGIASATLWSFGLGILLTGWLAAQQMCMQPRGLKGRRLCSLRAPLNSYRTSRLSL